LISRELLTPEPSFAEARTVTTPTSIPVTRPVSFTTAFPVTFSTDHSTLLSVACSGNISVVSCSVPFAAEITVVPSSATIIIPETGIIWFVIVISIMPLTADPSVEEATAVTFPSVIAVTRPD